MPALVKSRVGSSPGTSGELATTRWPCRSKYFRKEARISLGCTLSILLVGLGAPLSARAARTPGPGSKPWPTRLRTIAREALAVECRAGRVRAACGRSPDRACALSSMSPNTSSTAARRDLALDAELLHVLQDAAAPAALNRGVGARRTPARRGDRRACGRRSGAAIASSISSDANLRRVSRSRSCAWRARAARAGSARWCTRPSPLRRADDRAATCRTV